MNVPGVTGQCDTRACFACVKETFKSRICGAYINLVSWHGEYAYFLQVIVCVQHIDVAWFHLVNTNQTFC